MLGDVFACRKFLFSAAIKPNDSLLYTANAVVKSNAPLKQESVKPQKRRSGPGGVLGRWLGLREQATQTLPEPRLWVLSSAGQESTAAGRHDTPMGGTGQQYIGDCHGRQAALAMTTKIVLTKLNRNLPFHSGI